MIDLKEISHGFLGNSLFSGVNVRLFNNERYGVVGANGSGKSTLLKIVSGEIEPDEGDVIIAAQSSIFRIGQDHHLDDDALIIDTAMMGKKTVYQALKKKESLLLMAQNDPNFADDIARVEEILESGDGYRLRSLAQSILEGLGIKSKDHEKPLRTLSGGYKWRVFLAQALVKKPQILMLDEPTNHLDIVSIRWLEIFLSKYEGLVLLVSHDRKFLDNVCTQILDVDFGTVIQYKGNYKLYEKARELFLTQKEKEIIAQEKEIKHKQNFIDRFRYKASKARQAQSRIKQLEKIEIIEPVRSSRVAPKLSFAVLEDGPKDVLKVENLSKSYGDKSIIKNLSFEVRRGEKIGIIGPNGSGKSTLIKALALSFAECLCSIKWGQGTKVGYFAQDCGAEIKNSNETVLSWLWQHCADKPQSFVQGFLGRVLFSKDDVKKKTSMLSGGELGRLYLSYLMMKEHNVLLMDEPTNHLDLESIESLARALSLYPGTLIFVSHDRRFIDQVAKRIFALSDEGIEQYLGIYSEFVATKDRDYLDASKEASQCKKMAKLGDRKSFSYEEQKKLRSEFNRLKKRLTKVVSAVDEMEEEISHIDNKFSQSDFFEVNGFEVIHSLQKNKEHLQTKLEGLMAEWEKIEKDLQSIEIRENAKLD